MRRYHAVVRPRQSPEAEALEAQRVEDAKGLDSSMPPLGHVGALTFDGAAPIQHSALVDARPPLPPIAAAAPAQHRTSAFSTSPARSGGSPTLGEVQIVEKQDGETIGKQRAFATVAHPNTFRLRPRPWDEAHLVDSDRITENG